MNALRVTKKHHIDHGQRGADGYYDYYYAYNEYAITVGDSRYGLRVYDDEPEVAYVHDPPSPRVADRNYEELRQVLAVLRDDGVTELRMLGGSRSGGYVRVDP